MTYRWGYCPPTSVPMHPSGFVDWRLTVLSRLLAVTPNIHQGIQAWTSPVIAQPCALTFRESMSVCAVTIRWLTRRAVSSRRADGHVISSCDVIGAP